MRRELQDANAPRPSTGHSARHTQGTAPEQRMTPRATAAQPRTVLRSGWGSEARSVIRDTESAGHSAQHRAQRPAQGTAPNTGRTEISGHRARPRPSSSRSSSAKLPRSLRLLRGLPGVPWPTWASTSPCRRVRLGHPRGLPHLRAGAFDLGIHEGFPISVQVGRRRRRGRASVLGAVRAEFWATRGARGRTALTAAGGPHRPALVLGGVRGLPQGPLQKGIVHDTTTLDKFDPRRLEDAGVRAAAEASTAVVATGNPT